MESEHPAGKREPMAALVTAWQTLGPQPN